MAYSTTDSTSDVKSRLLKNRRITEVGCWIWTASIRGSGYGRIKWKGKTYQVHVLSLMLFKPEEYDSSKYVLHKNICTSKRCFNPDHLYSGTLKDNAQDFVKTGNHHNTMKTSCPRGHEYTPENTRYQIKRNGLKVRKCIACQNLSNLFRSLNH